MSDLRTFLSTKRAQNKFQNFVDLSAYAKTRGYDISSESLRLCEKGERVPNETTRKILIDIYKMSDDETDTFNRLCATEILVRDFPDLIPIDAKKAKLFNDTLTIAVKHLPADLKTKLLENMPWIKNQLT